MRQALVAATVVAVAVLIANPVPAADDVLGWQDFRWGMSEQQVKTTASKSGFQLKVRKDTDAGEFFLPFESTIVLHQQTFEVLFFFLKATQRLQSVWLTSAQLSAKDVAGAKLPERFWIEPPYTKILETLTEKYGAPTPNAREHILPDGTKLEYEPDLVWTFRTTRITLGGFPKPLSGGRIQIHYESTAPVPKKSEKDKL